MLVLSPVLSFCCCKKQALSRHLRVGDTICLHHTLSRYQCPACCQQVDVSKDGRALQKLRREAERAKRALSSQHQVRVEVESLAEGIDLSEPLTRARFEELNNDLFKKTLGPVKRVRPSA